MTDAPRGWTGDPIRPVALVILDGWGLAEPSAGNAVALAHTPNFDELWSSFPHTTLQASGLAVGLPEGQIGNSEVGHLNLGAGRVVYQDLARIDRSIDDGAYLANPVLERAYRTARERGSTFHVVALLSSGGVHSHVRHVEATVTAAAMNGVHRIAVHAITDGRDVSPEEALTVIPAFERFLSETNARFGCDAHVATVIGRYWAMDRDRRWDRTQRAYEAFTTRLGARATTASEAIRESHAAGTTDEFVEPSIVTGPNDPGGAVPRGVLDGDVVFFANFRPDRMRQICHAFADDHFKGFARSTVVECDIVTMTRFDEELQAPVAFAAHDVSHTLADVLEAAGIGQLHVAETEKYAHVTYFFNGGDEREHDGERRALVPSPRDVATYDLKPGMSAAGVADAFCEGIADGSVGFAIVNFANPDMVGHTGSIPATIEACETVDRELARVIEAVRARGGACIVTADHGNAEVMLTPEGKPHTAHTTNPVPLVVTLPELALRAGGKLGDVAPTVLDLMGLDQPAQMTGATLLARPREVRGSASEPGPRITFPG